MMIFLHFWTPDLRGNCCYMIEGQLVLGQMRVGQLVLGQMRVGHIVWG